MTAAAASALCDLMQASCHSKPTSKQVGAHTHATPEPANLHRQGLELRERQQRGDVEAGASRHIQQLQRRQRAGQPVGQALQQRVAPARQQAASRQQHSAATTEASRQSTGGRAAPS